MCYCSSIKKELFNFIACHVNVCESMKIKVRQIQKPFLLNIYYITLYIHIFQTLRTSLMLSISCKRLNSQHEKCKHKKEKKMWT